MAFTFLFGYELNKQDTKCYSASFRDVGRFIIELLKKESKLLGSHSGLNAQA